MRFARALVISLALLFASGFALFYHIFMISSYDKQGYDKLNAPQESVSSFSTKQSRKGVVKNLLLTRGEERRTGVLKASDSEFFFEKEGGARGLLEEMENTELIYQEELLSDDMQLALKMTASKSSYDYEKEILIAYDAALTRYRLPGHKFPANNELKDPFFVGSAQEVRLKQGFLKAYELKCTTGPYSLFAQEVNFEKNALHCVGGFYYEHPLGILQAKSAWASFEELHAPPKEILMEEGVLAELKNGTTFQSVFSRFDGASCTAFFHGLEGNKVILKNENQSLDLTSLEMKLQFSSHSPLEIDYLTAEGDVEMGFPSGLKLQGKRALFHEFTPKGNFSKAVLSEDCLLTKEEEADIYASEIIADIALDQATLKTAHGILQKNANPLQFCAHQIRIDRKAEKMFLDPPVTLLWGGVLETLGKVEITGKGKLLSFLHIAGPSILKIKDDQDIEHTLKTSGTILINPETKQITALSHQGEQIHFSDIYGDIYADRLQIHYQEVDKKLIPLEINLEGNIRVQNIHTGLKRYALAEKANYHLEKRELTLKSKPPARVLFYDLANKIQASAPALVLKRNPVTQKDEMKGLGNVRFLLAEDEWNELKKRFSFE